MPAIDICQQIDKFMTKGNQYRLESQNRGRELIKMIVILKLTTTREVYVQVIRKYIR